MFLPTITYGFAIIYAFGRQGLITRLLGGRQLFDIYGASGLMIGYIIYTLPISFVLINNTMGYIDKKFLVVSRVLGDNAPRSFMIYDCMDQICRNGHDPFPCEAVVKIDDTAAGINRGNNAGAWTIAVYASGSNTFDQLAAAEPDYLVPDISYVASVIFESIQPALRDGFRPGGGR